MKTESFDGVELTAELSGKASTNESRVQLTFSNKTEEYVRLFQRTYRQVISFDLQMVDKEGKDVPLLPPGRRLFKPRENASHLELPVIDRSQRIIAIPPGGSLRESYNLMELFDLQSGQYTLRIAATIQRRPENQERLELALPISF